MRTREGLEEDEVGGLVLEGTGEQPDGLLAVGRVDVPVDADGDGDLVPRPASCADPRARRIPRRATSIQCTGWVESQIFGPPLRSAVGRPQVFVERTSQPVSTYLLCTACTSRGASRIALTPHRCSSTFGRSPATWMSSVPVAPSRSTQRSSAMSRASRA